MAYTPQGSWALALVPLAGSTISGITLVCELDVNRIWHAFRVRIANGELQCRSPDLVIRDGLVVRM